MKSRWILRLIAVSVLGFTGTHAGENSGLAKAEVPDFGFLSNTRQLTFEGSRSGEGYFSADGKKMIFQSERETGNPFYQIYLFDLQSGKTSRVSPGKGKTTCSWVHPNGKKVMFSSTHLDSSFAKKAKDEYESRKAQVKAKYAWSYDETFDIFETDLDGKHSKQLTHELGYDAEGSYSPDGKWIAFASNRSGYSEKLSDEDAKMFNRDASYLMDIYIMRADGSDVKRLTSEKGYDGGPFFSPDGKKITWRRFSPTGQTAEIYTMNTDGSDQKQITRMKVMSWAPYFHRSGDYIVFASNLYGFNNFELFLVDSEGKKEPLRITNIDGFDGLASFSPDGQKLSWTHRNEKGESQIYIADWNDAKARDLLGLPLQAPALSSLSPELNEKDARAWVQYFASNFFAGRKTGSPEEVELGKGITKYFKSLGLKPMLGDNFIQEFEFTSNVALGSKNEFKFKVNGKENTLTAGENLTPISFSKTGDFPEAPIVFAGYGIIAPANEKQPIYDSYRDLDVKGKWVLAFRDIPENIPNERRIFLNIYSRLHHKAMVARNAGAVGLILVNGPNSSAKQLIKLRFDGSSVTTGIPVLHISDKAAEKLVSGSEKNLKSWQDANDSGEVKNGTLGPVVASAKVDLLFEKSKGHNILAVLPARGATKTLLIGAHGDHLGRGETGSSLARTAEQGQIHFGADDNASGMSGVMQLAHSFSATHKKGAQLGQNLAFAIWSGEELGLLGSSHFLETIDAKTISAYLNMDMIGRLRDSLSIQGVGSAAQWPLLFEEIALKTKTPLSLQSDPYLPTDSMAFYMKEIPSVTFFTGAHGDYHSPRDRAETLNYPGLVAAIEVLKMTAEKIGRKDEKNALPLSLPLTYAKVESSHKQLEGRSFRLYLGTIPNYSKEGVKGVEITGTSKDSPAEKAGLVAGDVIIELASIKVENIYDYVYCLQSMKANQETGIKVLRAGQVFTMKITPTIKE